MYIFFIYDRCFCSLNIAGINILISELSSVDFNTFCLVVSKKSSGSPIHHLKILTTEASREKKLLPLRNINYMVT